MLVILVSQQPGVDLAQVGVLEREEVLRTILGCLVHLFRSHGGLGLSSRSVRIDVLVDDPLLNSRASLSVGDLLARQTAPPAQELFWNALVPAIEGVEDGVDAAVYLVDARKVLRLVEVASGRLEQGLQDVGDLSVGTFLHWQFANFLGE